MGNDQFKGPGQYPLISGQAVHGAFETVERFQCQERAFMLASLEVDDAKQIRAEEEFISPFNRFHVAVSRVRANSIALLSRRRADHVPSEPRVLGRSRLLSYFMDGCLRRSEPICVPGVGTAELRFR